MGTCSEVATLQQPHMEQFRTKGPTCRTPFLLCCYIYSLLSYKLISRVCESYCKFANFCPQAHLSSKSWKWSSTSAIILMWLAMHFMIIGTSKSFSSRSFNWLGCMEMSFFRICLFLLLIFLTDYLINRMFTKLARSPSWTRCTKRSHEFWSFPRSRRKMSSSMIFAEHMDCLLMQLE